MTDERAYVQGHIADLHADLDAWLRIPSISVGPLNAADVRRSAEWLAVKFTSLGFPTVEIWETPGAPAVFAEWPSGDPDAPTIVVYGHHDVQPVDPLELWETPPFEPTIRGEELFGRGALDDKGQIAFHFLGLRAHLAATGRSTPAVNLKFVVEGEEDSGSPHFAAMLREHKHELACDVVVVSDTGMWSREAPTVCVGMRGMTDGQLDLRGPSGDVHFGASVAPSATR